MTSLRTRIAVLLMLVTTLGTITVGALSYVAAANRLDAEVSTSLDSAAAAASHGGRGGPDRGGRDDGPDDSTVTGPVLVQTLYPDGRVDSAPAGLVVPVTDLDRAVAAGQLASVRYDTTIDGQPYRVLTVPRDEGRGAAMAVRSTAEIARVLDTLRWQIVLSVVVVALVAGLLGWLVAQRLTRRLVSLTVAAEQVAATGRLDVAVPTDGRDETGRLGTSFASMLAALARSREAQQRLVQDAGHELRTPLTSLRTNVSVLRRYEAMPVAEREQVLVDLDAETRELTDLVNELVTLSAVGADEEATTTVRLGDLADRVAGRVERRYGVDVQVQDDGTTVVGRSAALERAVGNLVDNAAKFGGTAGPVEVSIARGTVVVTDHGPGIPAADQAHVFDRFFRSDASRSMPGSGLGLAIVRDVVQSHGGQVFATTDALGTHVGFTLPAGAALT